MQKFSKAAIVLAVTGALALTACGSGRTEPSATDAAPAPSDSTSAAASEAPAAGFPQDAVIGVSLPQKTSENWVLAEGLFTDGLKQAGYNGIVQFANGGVTEQQNQISAMITKGAKVIAVGAIDGSQLSTQLKEAKDQGVIVIAYERLLTGSPDVDFYVTFDNYKIGQLQGQALLEGLAKLKGDVPYNVELLAGSPDDSNAAFFFDGAMSVLQPKIDDGTLKVLSGQTEYKQVVTPGWTAKNAQNRMDAILAANYQNEDLDGILSPNDNLARAALTAAQSAGKTGDHWPVATGLDSEVESVKWVAQGKQYSTIYKDTRAVVAKTIELIGDAQQGKPMEPNDTETYNNGVKVVPSYLITPILVTKDNVAEVYVDDPNLGPVVKEALKG
ncbi:MAG: sugar-binding protein [Propionicimonas sp.]|nr:sugar-binding protein [Propionicimonas sp.]